MKKTIPILLFLLLCLFNSNISAQSKASTDMAAENTAHQKKISLEDVKNREASLKDREQIYKHEKRFEIFTKKFMSMN